MGVVILESDWTGNWSRQHYFLAAEPGRFRSNFGKGSVDLTGSDGKPIPPPPPTPSDAQRWALAAAADDAVANVLSYLRGDPDWFNLYKAFEAVRSDVTAHLAATLDLTPEQTKDRCWSGARWAAEFGADPARATQFATDANARRHHRSQPLSRTLPADQLAASADEQARNEDEALQQARDFLRELVKLWLAWRSPPAPPNP